MGVLCVHTYINMCMQVHVCIILWEDVLWRGGVEGKTGGEESGGKNGW